MISAKSIALAESIAVNCDGLIKSSQIIKGLGEVSHGSFPYTEQFREEIVHATQNTTDHTAIVGASSDALALAVRNAFAMVKDFGVPYAKTLSRELSVLYTPARLNEVSGSLLKYSFVNVEEPYFESPIYPTEVKNTALNTSGISLKVLDRLEFGYPSMDEVREYLDVSHPDLEELISAKSWGMSDAFSDLTSRGTLAGLFHQSEDVFNFTVLKSLEIGRLLRMYVLLTKMYSDDDPVKWLSKGNLADYREYVSVLWNGMTRYLISLKQVAGAYKARVIAFNEVKPLRLESPADQHLSMAKIISGEVLVFYTREALEKVNKQGYGFPDWFQALAFARFNGTELNSVELLGNGALIKEWVERYRSSINSVLLRHAETEFIRSAKNVTAKYLLETPLLNERVREISGDNQTVDHWLMSAIGNEFPKAYFAVAAAVGKNDVGDCVAIDNPLAVDETVLNALLGCSLVPAFLRAINCGMAADIVEETFVSTTGAESIASKRERLHIALLKVLSRILLKPSE